MAIFPTSSTIAAVCHARVALEAIILNQQAMLQIEALFVEDFLHTLEPSRHGWVIIREVEILVGGIRSELCQVHPWTILVGPSFLWILQHVMCQLLDTPSPKTSGALR